MKKDLLSERRFPCFQDRSHSPPSSKMMVPRAFLHTTIRNERPEELFEKVEWRRRSTGTGVSPERERPGNKTSDLRNPSKPRPNAPSLPVHIPTRSAKRPSTTPLQDSIPPPPPSSPAPHAEPSRKQTPQEILSATAIPIRRRPKARASQRLPNCDHVADFSKLLLEDVTGKEDGSPPGSLSNPQFESLFGNIDGLVEGEMFVGSEGVDASVMSARSISTESMPSLASPDDYTQSGSGSSAFSPRKSLSDRRLRLVASSEDCASSHPLLHLPDEWERSSIPWSERSGLQLRSKRKPPPPRSTSSFKSSLSASLRALKSAAESLSNNIATANSSAMQPDDFAIFSIQPSLTDDKRPPPSSEPPSPALRRYLNPLPPGTPPESPVHLHFWHDERHTVPAPVEPRPSSTTRPVPIKKKSNKNGRGTPSDLPAVVPLQSCLPSTIRTAHASSPPIWLAPDGTPSNKHTAHYGNARSAELGGGLPRQREPRENRDFLRILVAEMNMRRAGKLEDPLNMSTLSEKRNVGKNEMTTTTTTPPAPAAAAAGRYGKAVMWLPPVKEDFHGKHGEGKLTGRERWKSWSLEDLRSHETVIGGHRDRQR